ncbi:MAG: cobalamin-dependent protein [Planctomycetota bacterium]
MNPKGLFAAEVLDQCRRSMAADVLARHVESEPGALATLATLGLGEATAIVESSLACLAEAVATEREALFVHDVSWRHAVVRARKVPSEHVTNGLEAMLGAVVESLPPAVVPRVRAVVQTALDDLSSMPATLPSCLPAGSLRATAQNYLLAVLENRPDRAWGVLEAALRQGVPGDDLVRDVLMATQAEVGRMWQLDELSIVEEHMASEIAESCLARVYQSRPTPKPLGRRVLAASVAGDLHRVGPRWLSLAFATAGWEVVALGADLPHDELAHAVVEFDVDAVCLAATMVTNVRRVAHAVASVRSASVRRRPVVLVGGLPFRLVDDLWQVVGADVTAADPIAAVGAAASALA